MSNERVQLCLSGGLHLARLAQRSLAASANVQTQSNTVDNNALLVHVRTKITIRAALGEAHIIAEGLGLSANITFSGHGHAPFENCCRAARRENSWARSRAR